MIEVRRYLAGLALANEYEIEELRKAPVELKLRQLWALMNSPTWWSTRCSAKM
jgi:hypothetical protein